MQTVRAEMIIRYDIPGDGPVGCDDEIACEDSLIELLKNTLPNNLVIVQLKVKESMFNKTPTAKKQPVVHALVADGRGFTYCGKPSESIGSVGSTIKEVTYKRCNESLVRETRGTDFYRQGIRNPRTRGLRPTQDGLKPVAG